MRKPKGFDEVNDRSARADGGADAAATTTGKSAWTPEALATLFAGLGTFFGGALDGTSKVIDSTRNNNQLSTAGVQYMSVPASGNKTLLWVLGGGLLLVVLLVLVLRKK